MGWFSFVLAQQRVGGKLSDSLEKNWILNETHTWHDCFLLGKSSERYIIMTQKH